MSNDQNRRARLLAGNSCLLAEDAADCVFGLVTQVFPKWIRQKMANLYRTDRFRCKQSDGAEAQMKSSEKLRSQADPAFLLSAPESQAF